MWEPSCSHHTPWPCLALGHLHGRQPYMVLSFNNWSLIFSKGTKTQHFPGVPPPPPPSSQFMMKNYFWYPTIIKNVTEGWAWHTWGKHWEYKPLLGDNGQSLFPLGISLIPSPLSKLCSSLTLSWGPPSETLLKTASAPHPLPTPFLSAITFINIQDTLQSTCLVYLLFTSFFSHRI